MVLMPAMIRVVLDVCVCLRVCLKACFVAQRPERQGYIWDFKFDNSTLGPLLDISLIPKSIIDPTALSAQGLYRRYSAACDSKGVDVYGSALDRVRLQVSISCTIISFQASSFLLAYLVQMI